MNNRGCPARCLRGFWVLRPLLRSPASPPGRWLIVLADTAQPAPPSVTTATVGTRVSAARVPVWKYDVGGMRCAARVGSTKHGSFTSKSGRCLVPQARRRDLTHPCARKGDQGSFNPHPIGPDQDNPADITSGTLALASSPWASSTPRTRRRRHWPRRRWWGHESAGESAKR